MNGYHFNSKTFPLALHADYLMSIQIFCFLLVYFQISHVLLQYTLFQEILKKLITNYDQM